MKAMFLSITIRYPHLLSLCVFLNLHSSNHRDGWYREERVGLRAQPVWFAPISVESGSYSVRDEAQHDE